MKKRLDYWERRKVVSRDVIRSEVIVKGKYGAN